MPGGAGHLRMQLPTNDCDAPPALACLPQMLDEPGSDGPRAGTGRVAAREQALLHIGEMTRLSRSFVCDQTCLGEIEQDRSALLDRKVGATKQIQLVATARRDTVPGHAMTV